MKRKNLKKENENSFIEEKGLSILKTLLESTKSFKTYFSQNDKTPIFDGYFNYLDKNFQILKRIEVQIKSHKKIKLITKGVHRGKYKYEFDTSILNSIKFKITNDPTIYFVVDCENQRCFFKLIDKDFLVNLHYDDSKKRVSYYFDENDIIKDTKKFVDLIDKLYTDSQNEINFKSVEEIKTIQLAMNDFYSKLNELSFIKESIWPDLWKFGIRCSNVDFCCENLKTNNVHGPKANAFAIFPILLGSEKKEITDYTPSKDNLFNCFDLTCEKPITEYLNDCLSRILNFYFDSFFSLKILPDICLDEIIFSILDKLSKVDSTLLGDHFSTCKYSEISMEQFLKIVQPYIDAKNHIIKQNIESISDRSVIKFFFNNSCFDSNNFKLIYFTEEILKECRLRNKKKFNRIWDYFVDNEKAKLARCKDEFFCQEKMNSSIQKLFDSLILFTDEIINNLPIKLKNPLCQEYFYNFYFDNNEAFSFYVMDMALINADCKSDFKKVVAISNKDQYIWRSRGIVFSKLLWSRTPLFYLLKVIIHYSICMKFKIKYIPISVEDVEIDYPFFENF